VLRFADLESAQLDHADCRGETSVKRVFVRRTFVMWTLVLRFCDEHTSSGRTSHARIFRKLKRSRLSSIRQTVPELAFTPQELYATVPHLKIPFVPIRESGRQPIFNFC
jgi:hypothetical protein